MLDPRQRLIYLTELRPPEGYVLDSAISTTYTLDLISLLMAPLSMALYEAQNQEAIMHDPIAVLEALRRTADRIAVFCQKGRIALPKNNTRLVSLLEKAVVQVEPPDDSGVFHPKTWLLRFTADDEPTIYRFLCLSRNLTFDRSWDTILSLEGEQTKRKRAYKQNRPLSDFIASLPEMASDGITSNGLSLTKKMADEILTVNFKPPPDVSDFGLLPRGIPGYMKKPDWGDPSRIMIVSPFLSKGQLSVLAELGADNVLISRPESLDEISDEVLDEVEENCDIFIMDQDAETPEPDEDLEAGDEMDMELTQFTGLHAKLFIIESGWDASLYTGSVNFSDPALNGRNVEFMVELQGKRSKLGIERFLGGEGQTNTFRAMLKKYSRDPSLKKDLRIERELERLLDEARAAIAGSELNAAVAPADNDLFDLAITNSDDLSEKLNSVSGRLYPISLKATSGKPIHDLQSGESLKFSGITPIALTSFFAFEIEAKVDDKSAAIAFVLNIPVENMPDDRDNRLLKYLISDQNNFIRYLLFILMEGDGHLLTSDVVSMTAQQEGNNGFTKSLFGFQLLEELVRAYSRAPEKIDRIARLVDDLGSTPEGHALFPPGFEEVWNAFKAARGIKETER